MSKRDKELKAEVKQDQMRPYGGTHLGTAEKFVTVHEVVVGWEVEVGFSDLY